jgi:hypothetical protein
MNLRFALVVLSLTSLLWVAAGGSGSTRSPWMYSRTLGAAHRHR